MSVDRYRVNDVLSALCAEVGATLSDDDLNELTHVVADALDGATNEPSELRRVTPI